LLEVQRVEESLAGLPAVEPSAGFSDRVMRTIALLQQHPVPRSVQQGTSAIRSVMVLAGALILGLAYILPAAGNSWLSNLLPAAVPLRSVGLSAYLAQHPPWAVFLAGLAAVLIALGLSEPERRLGNRLSSEGS
jgi:hypothetical protein